MDQTTAVRRRLLQANGVDLDEPYFVLEGRWMKMGKQQCMHDNHGVRLDEIDRRCYCRGCGLQIDPFEALLNYANAESRLVSQAEFIKQSQHAEATRKANEKARRPFVRTVTGWTAIKDMTLKAEPVIGYTLTLECGHSGDFGPNRKPKHVTCRACQADAVRETLRSRDAHAGKGQTVNAQ